MILKLTEYRKNGNDYPILIFAGDGTVIREANLEKPGDLIIGESRDIGKGAFITLPFNQVPIAVRETVAVIAVLAAQPNIEIREAKRPRRKAPVQTPPPLAVDPTV